MVKVNRLWRINGLIKPLSPAALFEQDYDLPDGWHGLANGVTLPRGRRWGEANFLVAASDLELLEGVNTLDCEHENGTTTWKGYSVESYEAVTKQMKSPAYWVRFADHRWLLERSSAEGKRYNLRSSTSGYVAATLNSGTPYTWSQVISDLWSLLPTQAGTAPSLARVPTTTPENLGFDGVSAWGAINQILTAIGQCVIYDPFAELFTIVDLTVTQSITYPDVLLFDSKPGGGDYDLPEKAGVLYPWLPPDDSSYSPFFKAPHYAEATLGGTQGVYQVLDTFYNYTGRVLTSRTTEIGSALGGLLDPMVNPVDKIFGGVWQQLPGSRLSELRWTSDGYRGFETRAIYDFEDFDWPKIAPYSSGGGGGGKFAARLRGAWSSKTVSAQIYTLDGVDVVYKETATLYDPLSVFAGLNIDDWGYCFFQDGKYYAADAMNCPDTSPLITSPPATQP
jgi:hypothetical protein